MRTEYPSNRSESTHGRRVPPVWLWLGFVAMLHGSLAVAQNNLGELLDAGAKKLSPEEFREEIVQRVIVGPTPSGLSTEVMYASTGVIAGLGTGVTARTAPLAPISGTWMPDHLGRVCTTMQIGGGGGRGSLPVETLPPRCQYWYKLDQRYYFSDSDTDRSMRVLPRTIKP